MMKAWLSAAEIAAEAQSTMADQEPSEQKKEWFSLKDIALMKLPGLRMSKRNLQRYAEKNDWNFSSLSRQRAGRGAGRDYHYTLFPKIAQSAVVRQFPSLISSAPKVKPNWVWYDSQPAKMKDAAKKRLEIIVLVPKRNAKELKKIAAEAGIKPATIYNWLDKIKGLDRGDWLPALLPLPRGGGGKAVEVDERFWDAFLADYLRPARPSFNSCFRRVERIAIEQGWPVPNMRTLRRRVDAIPEAVLTLAREGRDATKALFPAQERDRTGFHALEAVNADGHKWDVFVKWEDGTIGRPMMIAFQDLYSNMFLAWRIGRSENKDAVRLCFGDLVETYGVPDHCWLDNGRAFASKWLTGGIPNRFRFKVKPEEPVGIFTQLGVQVHWTTPYAGQSKPIERGFGDFARDIAKHPAFDGAYTGNSPMAKPEDYGNKAVPIALFAAIIDSEIAAHNARAGRQTKVCGGKLSFQQAFDASYATAMIRKATAEQRRMCMLAAEGVKVRRQDGAIILQGNRYWHEKLLEQRGRPVTVRFDPDELHTDLPVYAQDGTLICVAELVEAAGFADTTAAREHAAARNAYLRATRERLAAERKMSLAELVALQPKVESYEPPESKIVRPFFAGNLALKPAAQVEAEDDEFDTNFAKGLRLVRDQAQEF